MCEHLAVALAVDNLAKVLHANFASLAAEDDRVFDLLEALIFVDGANHVFCATLSDATSSCVDVLSAQTTEHLADRKVDTLQFGFVDQHVNFLLQSTADSRRRDPLDRFNLAFDLQFSDSPQAP